VEEALVVGRVITNQAVPSLLGQKLLWIDPLDESGERTGNWVVAVDTTRSGEGERVIFVRSREAAESLENPFTPVDAAITGIVDRSERNQGN